MPKIDVNGVIREMTPDEIAAHETAVNEHLASVPVDEVTTNDILNTLLGVSE